MSDPSAQADTLPPGTVLAGRWIVDDCIGIGGMAQVYRGHTTQSDRALAIKVLAPDVVRRHEQVTRFLQEARAASRVSHPNVVEVTDVAATDDGRPFIVMEYLAGESLATTLLAEGPFDWARTRALALQMLGALQAAHEHRVIHRDMKPGNCFVIDDDDQPERLKVLDFGIAKVLREDGTGITLTQTGRVMGTPDYMAPEQCRGEPIDGRVDVYAVGVMMFEMLTGRLPFAAKQPVQVMHEHVFARPPALKEVAPDADAPPAVAKLVRRAMAKKPGDRFASAAEFAAAVTAVEPTRRTADSGLLSGLRRLFDRDE